MKLFISIVSLFFIFQIPISAQSSPFQISLEPMTIPELAGVQSFAFGQHDGKWLIVGGRRDGLHRRQPWASFDEAGLNTELTVVDPVVLEKWTASLSSLPVGIQEQLSATNMEFFQEGDHLYVLGGYGYSNSESDHVTYPNLTAIKVSEVIEAIINETDFASSFRQITDEKFAVTGGYLNKIYDTFYLTGGQRFDGRYNPMNNPTFVQEYTNAIRKFELTDDGINIVVNHLGEIVDETNLHRRDFNVVEQITENGEEGLTAFSGVFQLEEDLPFLDVVNIDSSGYEVDNSFTQHYNHYHCAQFPIFSETAQEMHTVFFGGIAQYYDNNGTMIQDNEVPFVKTIARVTRDANGLLTEYKLPIEMPSFLGAGSEFIPVENLPQYPNGVLKLNELVDTMLIGYIYGGIESSSANIFWINNGTQSTASHQLFKVYLHNNTLTSTDRINKQSNGTLKLEVYPNPNKGVFHVKFNLRYTTGARLEIYDATGKMLETIKWKKLVAGEHTFEQEIEHLSGGGVYLVTMETSYERATLKVVIRE